MSAAGIIHFALPSDGGSACLMEAYFFPLHDGCEIAAARHRNDISGGCAPAHVLPLLQPSLSSQANAAVPLPTNTV